MVNLVKHFNKYSPEQSPPLYIVDGQLISCTFGTTLATYKWKICAICGLLNSMKLMKVPFKK